ncbi:hypothetical protein D3C79_48430 [compost metagenome]
MTPVQSSNVILVVADSNFCSLCENVDDYIVRLHKVLSDRQSAYTLMTVSGKYGISALDETVSALPVDDKNKTVFGQNLENISGLFDELLVLTNTVSDPYINVAKEAMGNAHKTITTYGYRRKQ